MASESIEKDLGLRFEVGTLTKEVDRHEKILQEHIKALEGNLTIKSLFVASSLIIVLLGAWNHYLNLSMEKKLLEREAVFEKRLSELKIDIATLRSASKIDRRGES